MNDTNKLAYYEKVNVQNELKLREQLAILPPYCKQFFIGIEAETASRTRLAYAYDLHCFFDYLHENNPVCKKMSIREIPLSILDELKPMDIEEYLYYLKVYEKDGVAHTNDERGLKRKLASLRSFYNYFFKNELIQNNPAVKVNMPKIHDKNIIRLDVDEVAMLLDEVESGESLSKRQQMYHERTKTRDLALLTLMLGTGIRVSECVGLDIEDVDLKNNGIKIHRKGGAEVIVYFGDEVAEAICNYLVERNAITAAAGHENALFLSMQNRRITVRAVENLVKKYSKLVTNLKNITPHKLRSTYGTSLYRETGDIYLVADVLGHKDVNTTKRHYAAISEDMRKNVANIIKEKNPKVVLLEKVRGLLTHDNGNTFEVIKNAMDELGYSFHYKILKASDYGVPQNRPRLYMVGIRKDLEDKFKFPEPIKLEKTMTDIFDGKKCDKEIGYTLRVGGRGSGVGDRRNWDSYIVNGKEYRIGIKEGKRMQGFPDDFVFPVSETQAMKELGNSVAIPVVQAVVKEFLYIL